MAARYPSLAARRVVITGGASGIGAAMVNGFVAQGAQVVFLDIATEAGHALEVVHRHAPCAPVFMCCDLTSTTEIDRAFAAIEQQFGGIDVLINNAANDDRHRVGGISTEYWDERIAANLRHQFFCAQAVSAGMRQRKAGVILNLGSISWHTAMAELSVYMTAKAGIEGMTRGLARELGVDGIRVNCIVPGAVRTARQTELWRNPHLDAQILASQCLQREILPADVAAIALFLASDDAMGCSGREYFVDGGTYGQ
ncbi:MAG: SDR family oxidoreductase [Rhodoferax sp.]